MTQTQTTTRNIHESHAGLLEVAKTLAAELERANTILAGMVHPAWRKPGDGMSKIEDALSMARANGLLAGTP